jgi:phage protein D
LLPDELEDQKLWFFHKGTESTSKNTVLIRTKTTQKHKNSLAAEIADEQQNRKITYTIERNSMLA